MAVALISVSFLKIEKESEEKKSGASIRSSFALLKEPYVLMMVLGIFFYVGAEVGLNSWIARLLQMKFSLDIDKMATLGIGFFMTALAIGRLAGSFILSYLSPKKFFLSTALVGVAAILGMFVPSESVVLVSIFLAGISFANVFPLIFSILIDTIPERSNELSGLLVMAIVGGAIIPALMGVVADKSVELSFVIPLAIFVYISFLAFSSLKKPGVAVQH